MLRSTSADRDGCAGIVAHPVASKDANGKSHALAIVDLKNGRDRNDRR